MILDYPFLAFGRAVDPPNLAWMEAGRLPTRLRQIADSLMANVSPLDANTWLFDSNNRSTSSPDVQWNPALWCLGKVDITPISVIRNAGDDRFPVILVHKNFVYSAAHTRGSGPFVFKRPDGGYETRTVVQWWSYPTITKPGSGPPLNFPEQSHYRDAAIGLLSAPIESITPALVLPEDWHEYFPPMPKRDSWPAEYNNGYDVPTYYIPALYRKARKADGTDRARMTIGKVTSTTQNGSDYMEDGTVWSPVYPYVYSGEAFSMQPEINWSDTAIGGDSGSPMLWAYEGGRLILLCTHYSSGSGPGVHESLERLEAGMNSLATTYGIPGAGSLALHRADFSAFNKYA